MRRFMMLLPMLTAVAACQPAGPSVAEASPSVAASETEPPAVTAQAARDVKVDNDLYSFEYSYPAAASAIPQLKAVLEADLESQKGKLEASAREARKAAADNGFPYHPHETSIMWDVVTELPDWLSLSASISTFFGGAHPNHEFTAMLWDKRAGVKREPTALFTSGEALSEALRPAFCLQLDQQRAKKRGKAIKKGSTDIFDECIDPVKSTVILGSSTRKAFDRIGVLVGPYAAGPYVEGSYEVTLPITAEVLALVKPQYRSYFAVGR